ncbi:putative proline/serine-rich protein [Mycena venus]|uniref:Putative proline/serine-rich protein n=1 Tax=Mycena venus TaxID=2733690 RepID=A0A8H6Y5E9_9AGAR|nr:putative proline/serine-rich protein [Mycena venus]
MATPAPPVSGSASSRWARTTSESGSAFSGLGRGGRGGGRGRSRGGRGRGGGGAGTSRTPSFAAEKPAASESSTSTSKPAASGSGPAPTQKPQAPSGSGQAPAQKPPVTSGLAPAAPAQKPSVPPAAASQKPTVPAATPARPKAHGRKSSRSAVPTVVVGPSTPSAETPASTSRPSNRRRRSQQLNSKGSAAGLKVNVPASLDDNLLRPQNRLAVPHTAPLPSKDTPPHLAGSSFDMRNNIDALVERVRAVAMDNRPSTPGSHIDWAGDDDEGLPDLDDWGVTTSVGDKDEMISPIIVDGLKPLPEPVAKPPYTL